MTPLRSGVALAISLTVGCGGCNLFRSTSDVGLSNDDMGADVSADGGMDVGLDATGPADQGQQDARPDADAAFDWGPDLDLAWLDLSLDFGGDAADLTAPDLGSDLAIGTDMAVDMPPALAPTCATRQPVDTSSPTTVVGTGTPASCTEMALRTAVSGGGIVTFDCGDAEHVIKVNGELAIGADTVIDGGGKIVLSGDDKSRILSLNTVSNAAITPELTVQRITFEAGFERPADGNCGAAIRRSGGKLTVIDSHFRNNSCAGMNDPLGGAISSHHGAGTFIYGSTFTGNTAPWVGAVWASMAPIAIVNSEFRNNSATAKHGGAVGLYSAEIDVCGSKFSSNTAASWGGAIMSTSGGVGSRFTLEASVFEGNSAGNYGGAADIEDFPAFELRRTSFVGNSSTNGGALYVSGMAGQIENVVFAGNQANGGSGGGIDGRNFVADIRHATFAENTSSAAGVAGAIRLGSGSAFTISNSIAVDNGGGGNPFPACSFAGTGSGGNIEFPSSAGACADDAAVLDPLLGAVDPTGELPVVRPMTGSPAIGAGLNCAAHDILGRPRPAQSCTSGAVEVP